MTLDDLDRNCVPQGRVPDYPEMRAFIDRLKALVHDIRYTDMDGRDLPSIADRIEGK